MGYTKGWDIELRFGGDKVDYNLRDTRAEAENFVAGVKWVLQVMGKAEEMSVKEYPCDKEYIIYITGGAVM